MDTSASKERLPSNLAETVKQSSERPPKPPMTTTNIKSLLERLDMINNDHNTYLNMTVHSAENPPVRERRSSICISQSRFQLLLHITNKLLERLEKLEQKKREEEENYTIKEPLSPIELQEFS